ncbi:MAG: LuxR C-terminal-related transcriptional regulator [Aeromicrobium sp.]
MPHAPATVERPPTAVWAVVEIRDDGTLGRTEVVSSARRPDGTTLGHGTPAADAAGRTVTVDLTTRLGLVQAAGGHLHEARRTLTDALSLSRAGPQAEACLGPLALIEAFLGRLSRAAPHADEVLRTSDTRSVAAAHARVAKAWIHLERAEFTESEQCLERVTSEPVQSPGPWLETARVLAEAQLLTARCQPDAAVGLLAAGVDTTEIAPASGWISGVLDAARADALLATGEPRRALAAVTPLPRRATVEASVAAAAARRDIGDVRGASAVLGAVVEALDASPLPLQVRARLLESRLADETGDHRRSWHLVDRALRSAEAEQLWTPLRDDWRWLRAFLDREPHLMHRHRAFIVGHDAIDVPRSQQMTSPPGSVLTQRECEVLELLAQLYSTEEIAQTLYVSANTVKTHVKGIFGKLCVSRRADAVRRGRALGLC